MLKMSNPDDLIKMKNYYRTNDMLNLLIYFNEVSPVRNLTIVESKEDYNNNIDYCSKLHNNRIDNLINKPIINSIQTSGRKNDISYLLSEIKKIDSDSVLVMFDLTNELSERYERYAGIAVAVIVGEQIIIEAVGKGFDGREVSKGISVHERYIIPWYEINKISIETFKHYQSFLIDQNDYLKTREERINFLKSLKINEQEFIDHIPVVYQEIPSFIWLDVMKKIIKKVPKMEEELILAGLKEFGISGHTEGKQYMPWQLFSKNRYGIKR
jgi:hypothetical protein